MLITGLQSSLDIKLSPFRRIFSSVLCCSQMDYDEAKSSFEDYDKDKDGKITWTEYVTKLSGDEVNQEDTDALKEVSGSLFIW